MTTLVLLSGGVDSTAAAALARASGEGVAGLFVSYGQNHAPHERAAARAVAHRLGITLHTTAAGPLVDGSTLLGGAVPDVNQDQGSTVVPNRNMTLIGLAASVCLGTYGSGVVTIGCNADDAAVYPDCRPEFIAAAAAAVQLATEGRVRLHAPFLDASKAEVVAAGRAVGAPLGLTYSCYAGVDGGCGRCGACTARAAAL